MSRDALIVGINTYQCLPGLQAPARDAEAIAQQLHSYGEFRVHRLPEIIQDGKPYIGQKTQVTLRDLETALINLFKPKGNTIPHTALFYFSGHGIQREAGIQEGYLALSDSNPDKGFYGLSLFWLRRLLQESPVRQRIIWLDCCHSGEFLNFLEADPGAHPGTDRLFMAASREYETAYESLDSPYSVFTQAILTGLDPHRVEAGVVTNHSLTDWVNHSLKGDIQQPLFESSGSEIILTRRTQGQFSATVGAATVIQSTDICPYRGLEYFDTTHSEYFFGREALTTQLIEKLNISRFVAVVGASGSGKSSLVRAGLIAQLQQRSAENSSLRIKLLTPTEHPLKSLASAFIDAELTNLERAEQLRRAEVFLQDGGIGLAQLVLASLPAHSSSTGLSPKTNSSLLLVIDQFEEVFTLSQSSYAEQERRQFIDCLMGALELAGDCLKIVIVLRADFLSKCLCYEGFARQVERHQVAVTPLKYEQIKATIVRPAQGVGLVCEPNLVYTMLLDVIGAPGELPLLQYTLLELWRQRRIGSEGGVARLTLDAYQELGGVRGTLQKRATESFYRLTTAEQAVAKRIFLALTQLGEGTEDTRRRVAKSELVSPAFPRELVDRVIEKLVAAKLIVINQAEAGIREQELGIKDQAGEGQNSSKIQHSKSKSSEPKLPATGWIASEVIDVAHEALIRNWSLLRDWLNESREILRRQRRIEQTAQEWDQAGQPSAGEYLLGGLRLRDAEDFARTYPQELSALAQHYIRVSCEDSRRARRESRRLQVAVPSVLVATLMVVLSQYHGAVRTRVEKDHQLQVATSRERAAIAQSILQDTNSDPMTALLISRLAAGTSTYEAQSSLREALQDLRLQIELRGHQGVIHQIAFSADQKHLATASADGTIRLWSIDAQTVYNTSPQPSKILAWSGKTPDQDLTRVCSGEQSCKADSQANIRAVAFSPDGQRVAAIAENSPNLKIWSVESGSVVLELAGSATIAQIAFSPTRNLIAAISTDHSLAIWRTDTGELQARLPKTDSINSVQFSPNGRLLLSTGKTGTVQLWQLTTDRNHGLKLERAATLPQNNANQALFSPSGRWIATVGQDGKAKLWDGTTGHLQQTFLGEGARSQVSAPSSGHRLPPPASQAIEQVQFSPNEQTLAAIDSNHRIWLLDARTGRLQKQLVASISEASDTSDNASPFSQDPDASGIEPLSFSPDGHLVAAGSHLTQPDGLYAVYLWDTQTGQAVGVLPGHKGAITATQFSPDGAYIATASTDGVVRLWSAEPGGELPTLKLPDAPVQWAMFLQSGETGKGKNSLNAAQQHSNWPNSLSLSTRQARLDPTQILLEPGSTSAASAPNPQSAEMMQPTIAPSGTEVTGMVTMTLSGKLQHWQILTNSAAAFSESPSSPAVYATAIKSYGPQHLWRQFLSSLKQQIQKLDSSLPEALRVPGVQLVAAPQQAKPGLTQLFQQLSNGSAVDRSTQEVIPGQTATLESSVALGGVAVSPNGQFVATADIDGTVKIYQVTADQSKKLVHRIQNWRMIADKNNVLSEILPSVLATQPQGNNGAIASSLAMMATTASGDPVAIRHLTFSPDGLQLLGVGDDLTVRLWDVQSGQLLQVFRGHGATVQQARFSSNGQWVVTASWDRTARIWEVSSGQAVKVLLHQDAVSSASFSPDGQQLVTGSWDHTARVWDTQTGEQKLLLAAHQKAVLDVQFSPSGLSIVTASADGSARLWDAETGTEQAQLRSAHQDDPKPILQASFSPDGQYVATLSEEGRVHLWAASWDMLLRIARDRSLRQLTPEECSRYLRLAPEACPKLPMKG